MSKRKPVQKRPPVASTTSLANASLQLRYPLLLYRHEGCDKKTAPGFPQRYFHTDGFQGKKAEIIILVITRTCNSGAISDDPFSPLFQIRKRSLWPFLVLAMVFSLSVTSRCCCSFHSGMATSSTPLRYVDSDASRKWSTICISTASRQRTWSTYCFCRIVPSYSITGGSTYDYTPLVVCSVFSFPLFVNEFMLSALKLWICSNSSLDRYNN